MNQIGVQTSGPAERLGLDETYRRIREWGFDAADVNINDVLTMSEIREGRIADVFVRGGRECTEVFRPFAEAARKHGVENFQAHAPIPSLVYPPENGTNARLIEVFKNVVRGCDSMNCRNLIIHPFFLDYEHSLTALEEWELNIESYSRLIPTAREYGVTICLENVGMRHNGKFFAAFTSDLDTACRCVDELNAVAGEPVFGFCLDTGHMLLCSLDPYRTVTRLGHRIRAFHIHDNDGREDLHLAPYLGLLDWDRFCAGVREIGYDRTLSFETYNMWNLVDIEVCGEMMRFIAACGKMFARKISYQSPGS